MPRVNRSLADSPETTNASLCPSEPSRFTVVQGPHGMPITPDLYARAENLLLQLHSR